MISFRGRPVFTSLAQVAGPAHTALLVYDALNHTLRSLGAQRRELVARWRHLIDEADRASIPVVYTRHRPGYDYASGPWVRYRMRVFGVADPEDLPDISPANPKDHEITEELRPRRGHIVLDKYLNSAFAGTPLRDLLHARGIRTLVLSGLVTESGIETTCRQALLEGFYVIVVSDCIGSPRTDFHAASLRYMERCADVCAVDELTSIWDRLRR